MYNIAVCDDEEILRKQLLDMLKTPEIEGSCTITDFASGDALLEANEKQPFDVVFLDIEMPGTNGMETAEKLKAKNPDILIIFISAHKNYVNRAFHVPAFQYLYKPLDPNEVMQEMELAFENLRSTRAFYTTPDGMRVLLVREIRFLEIQGHVLTIHSQEIYSCRGTLDLEAEKLKTQKFIRCHRSFLVNPYYIDTFKRSEIILRSKEHVQMSKDKRPDVIREYKDFMKRHSI